MRVERLSNSDCNSSLLEISAFFEVLDVGGEDEVGVGGHIYETAWLCEGKGFGKTTKVSVNTKKWF